VPAASTFALFLVAGVTLLAIPGPAVLYVVGRSIEGGRRAGLVSVLGIGTGTLFHVAAAAIGVSSLLVASATAFDVVRYAGAAYLVALGLRRLLTRTRPAATEDDEGGGSLRRLFLHGVVVNVLNPKTALFFFAFLPQFVDPARGAVAAQVFVLGLTYVLLGLLSDGLYAVTAGAAADRLRGSRAFARAERWVSGTVLVGLGVAAAVSGPHRRR
jgi:threonine/homoserine/homoserine lactone efflux protein